MEVPVVINRISKLHILENIKINLEADSKGGDDKSLGGRNMGIGGREVVIRASEVK